ncbi:MAG TPA: hypothetical protein VK358_07405 [Longimicrobium sp.]|nr:hypothetical protein [Longimicrobium sp.]
MTRSPSWYARRARVIRLRPLAAVLVALPLAACADRAEPAAGKTAAAADMANADTSALGIARRHLGPEVRQAVPYTVSHYEGRFIAAAMPVQAAVDDPLRAGVAVAPGGHEIVILEMPDTVATFAITKPGLYASALPGTLRPSPDDGALRHLTGVEDVNGDGDAEVWSVQHGGPRHPYTWEIRVYDRGGRDLYQLAAKRRRGGTGLDPASWDASATLRAAPAFRAWMERKLQALETQFGGADTAAGSGR